MIAPTRPEGETVKVETSPMEVVNRLADMAKRADATAGSGRTRLAAVLVDVPVSEGIARLEAIGAAEAEAVLAATVADAIGENPGQSPTVTAAEVIAEMAAAVDRRTWEGTMRCAGRVLAATL